MECVGSLPAITDSRAFEILSTGGDFVRACRHTISQAAAGRARRGRRAAPFVALCVFLAWLATPGAVHAQTCNATVFPNEYSLPTQTATINLETHCAGVTDGGLISVPAGTITGQVNTTAGSPQGWSFVVEPGATITASTASAINVNDSGFFLDNAGTLESTTTGNVGVVNGTFGATNFTIFNRTGATIRNTAGSGSGEAIALFGSGGITSITNQTGGTISANDTAIHIANSAGTVNNAGSIISTGTTSGSGVVMSAGGTVNNQAGGSITTAFGPGVLFTGTTTPGTVVSAGTINAGAQSVLFDNGVSNDIVELQPGYVMGSNVVAGLGTDTLRFGGTGTASFDLSRIDPGGAIQQYQGFETFSVTGAAWTFNNATSVGFSQTGGTLMGTGAFGSLAATGGTIAPGNSIGTMTVNGNFSLGAASTLQAEVNAAGQSDLVDVNGGTVAINGATLQVLELAGTYTGGPYVYTIIDNDGADPVAGTGFGTITNTLAFLTPTVSLIGGDGNDVVLILTGSSAADFSSAAKTPNQRSAAIGLNSLDNTAGSDGQAIRNAVLGINNANALVAFDTLSGEIHASLQNTARNTGSMFTDAIANRMAGQQALNSLGKGLGDGDEAAGLPASSANALAYAAASADAGDLFGTFAADFGGMDAYTTTNGTWIRGLGSIWSTDGDGNAAEVDGTDGGVMLGFDNITRVGGYGFAAGYTMTQADAAARFSNADIQSGHVSAYGAWNSGAWHARAIAGYSFHHFDTTRNIVIGALTRTAKADYAGHQFNGYLETGYTTEYAGVTVQPMLAARAGHLMTEAFTETGAGSVSLSVASQESTHVDAIAGLRASMAMINGDGSVYVPQARFFYSHAFGDIDPVATMTYAGGGTFAIAGTPLDRDRFTLGAGFTNHFNASTAAYVDFEATLASSTQAYAATAGFKIAF